MHILFAAVCADRSLLVVCVNRSLMVHGFATDEDGKKMSKSLGNVVDPNTVVNGGKVSGKDRWTDGWIDR